MTTRILIADDHRIVREGLRRLLESREEFSVVGEAANGEEAVRLASLEMPDVVLMDITMPKMSGIDAIREFQLRGIETKVLVLSMHESAGFVEESLRAGAAGYLVKDTSPAELFRAIEAVKRGDSYLSPSVTQQVVTALSTPQDQVTSSALMVISDREREVLALIAEGLSSKEIARELGVSLKTIESHRANLMDKLNIHKVSGLVRFAIRVGLVDA